MNAFTWVYQGSALNLEKLLPKETFHKRLTEKYERGWAEEREKKMFVASAFFLKSEGKGSYILQRLMQEFWWSRLKVTGAIFCRKEILNICPAWRQL